MESRHMVLILCVIFVLNFHESRGLLVRKYPLLMPNVNPDRDELYLCTPVKIVPKTFYLVGFEPNATMNTVHHMILFGCSVPGSSDQYWDCGEMSVSNGDNKLKRAIPCADGSHVLYAWARDAKALELPEDVGFQVGKGSKISYLVLQVHYSKKFPDGVSDDSGIFLMYTEERRSKLAGVILLGTGGVIPAHSRTNMEVSCEIGEHKTIYPFAYRTHTHSLGKVVSGYKVRRNQYGIDDWTLLGKRDPLTPQMFYPVANRDPIYKGDVLAARCTMESDRDRDTYVGPTNKDEMCNFYLMYYVENDSPLKNKLCVTQGPPNYYWSNGDLNNIPTVEASVLDDQPKLS
ncbi:Copper type II ascorbate-dependent monooxygenase, C-terminal domain [Popillia japonica]|uniref:peptidylglycine monooxygenase n=1 Tax=Popillia japonica TaxID=7064 RepID=A0AAW1NJZ9_POPJA